MKSKIFKTIFIAIIAASISRPACAAFFRVDSDSGAALRPGDEFNLRVYLSPSEGESLMGAKCSLSVDPEFVEISPDRNDYAADPNFQKVEQFKTDPEKGMVTFKARSASSLENEKLFLVVPAKLKKEGATFVNFTSSAMGADEKWAPSNNGYFKLFASENESADPLLFMALGEENSILSSASLSNSFKLKTDSASATSTISFDLGLAEAEKAAGVEDADIIIEFSKQSAKIGNGKYVRLDLMISKYPELLPITGIDVNIKYDPSMLQYVNSNGQAANQVEVVRRLDDMTLEALKALAADYNIQYTSIDFRGQAKPQEIQKAEIIRLIRDYEGHRDESIFNFVFENDAVYDDGSSSAQDKVREVKSSLSSNFVDNQKGEIHLTLLVDFTLDRKDIIFPQKVATLIFKGLRPGNNIPVEITSALIDNNGGKLLIRGSKVTIDPRQEACDSTLPPALCKGTFKVTGAVAFDMVKRRTERKVATANGVDRKTTIEKYSLSETWNMHMNGSLRNGTRVNGHINKMPDRPQIVDLELLGNNSSLHFGEFSTAFKGTSLINPKITNISGMEVGYDFGKYKLTGLMGEGKSTRGTAQFPGNNTRGPYPLSGGMIIPGTVQIATMGNSGKVYRADEYSVDYANNTVTFTDMVDSNTSLMATFEQSLLLFSSGNVNGLGLSYDSRKNNPQRVKGLKTDATFITTMAPKGGLKYSTDAPLETINMGNMKRVLCPEQATGEAVGAEGCSLIVLNNRNIIKGSVVMTNVKDGKTVSYFEDSPGVYVMHRSYSMGAIILKNSVFSGNVTFKYSYNEDVTAINRRVVVFDFADNTTQITNIPWPYDVLPGSEQIFLSRNNDYSISNDDIFIKYVYPAEDPWREESLDEEVVGGSSFADIANFETSSEVADSYSYRFDSRAVGNTPGAILFNQDVSPLLSPADKFYVKMRYKTAPPDSLESSEFAKTGLGVDVSYKPSKPLSIEAQYGKTNSDLSTSYASEEETFAIDVVTHYSDQTSPSKGKTCEYKTEGGVSKIICSLNHKNIKDPVDVRVRFCKFNPPDSTDCPLEDESESPKSFTAKEYEQAAYDFTSTLNGNFIQLDKTNNTITFVRVKFNDPTDGNKLKDKFFYEDKNINHRFITKGDLVTIRYLYAQTVDQLVEGDSAMIKSTYEGKRARLTFSKNVKDPYFDSSMGGKLKDGDAGGVVDRTYYAIDNLKFGKWKFHYNKDASISKKLEAGIVSSTSNTDIIKHGFTYDNAAARFIKSFYYTNSSTKNVGRQGIGIKHENLHKNDDNTDYKLNIEAIKNVMNFNFGYKKSSVANREFKTVEKTTITTIDEKNTKSMSATYNPFAKLRTSFGLEQTVSNTGSSSSNRNYKFFYTPFSIMTIDAGFSRVSTTDASVKKKFTEDNSYTFTLTRLRAIRDLNFTFTQKYEPRNNVTQYNTESDKKSAKFNVPLAKGLILSPSFTTSSSATQSATEGSDNVWDLKYNPPKSKRRLSIEASLKNSTSTTRSLTSAQSTPTHVVSETKTFKTSMDLAKQSSLDISLSDTSAVGSTSSRASYIINYRLSPTPNTSLSTMYTNSSESIKTTNDYKLDYLYSYNARVRFNASYKKTFDNYATAADLDTTSYDFNSTIAINDSSDLLLSYKQTLSNGPRAATTYLDVPNFSAKLRTSFR